MKTASLMISGVVVLAGVLSSGLALAARTVSPANGAPYTANNYGSFTYLNGSVLHTSSNSGSHSWLLFGELDKGCPPGGGFCMPGFNVAGHGNGVDPMNCHLLYVDVNGGATIGADKAITSDCNFTTGTDVVELRMTIPGDANGNPQAFYLASCSMPPAKTCAAAITWQRYMGFSVSPTQTTRRGSPSDGAPFPSTNYGHFTYLNGVVKHTYTGATENWDLYPQVEDAPSSPTTRTATVAGKGNGSSGLKCWGVALDFHGAGTIGNGQSTPAGCAGAATEIVTPAVTNLDTFLVTCQLPPAQASCDPRISSFRYRM